MRIMNSYDYLGELLKNELKPEKGLPEPVFEFVSSVTPMVNVDLLVRDENNRILLSWREDKFSGNVWHIPGGIIRFREKMETRIHQVAQRELHTDVIWNGQILAVNEIMSNHQERGHFISFLVECELKNSKELRILEKADTDRKAGELFWFSECPDNLIKCQMEPYKKYFVKERM